MEKLDLDLSEYSLDAIVAASRYNENELLDYIIEKRHADFVLNRLEDKDIWYYIADEYFIAKDEDDAIKILADAGMIGKLIGTGNDGLWKDDCCKLIEDIVEHEGWNYLYNLLEEQKTKLNLL